MGCYADDEADWFEKTGVDCLGRRLRGRLWLKRCLRGRLWLKRRLRGELWLKCAITTTTARVDFKQTDRAYRKLMQIDL